MATLANAKRFYKTVAVSPSDDGWQIVLDDRAVKSPSGAPLSIAQRSLADAIAEEWAAQGERLQPDSMPLYKLVATAIDRVGPRRDEVVTVSLKFAETDLLCYRAETPPPLVERQSMHWQPMLEWAREALGAELRVTQGVVPVNQPAAALAALERALGALDPMALTGVSALAAATSSLVIAFALAHGRIDAATAAELTFLDEAFQVEHWGEDREASERRRRIRAEIEDTARFLKLIG